MAGGVPATKIELLPGSDGDGPDGPPLPSLPPPLAPYGGTEDLLKLLTLLL